MRSRMADSRFRRPQSFLVICSFRLNSVFYSDATLNDDRRMVFDKDFYICPTNTPVCVMECNDAFRGSLAVDFLFKFSSRNLSVKI